MPWFRERTPKAEVEAHQWWRNGSHPNDQTHCYNHSASIPFLECVTIRERIGECAQSEGKLVRRFSIRRPGFSSYMVCGLCHHLWRDHGWIDSGGMGQTVCPGDWVITLPNGHFQVMRSDKFREAYEEVQALS